MSVPLVSVCIPSYNKARFIEDALESVRAQSFKDFELIVIDDCSTDSSVSVVENWIAKTGFACRLSSHAANQGLCKTMNHMMTLSEGRYFAGLGADDLWYPGMLEAFAGAMKNSKRDTAVVYGDAQMIDESGDPLGLGFIASERELPQPPEGQIFPTLIEGNFIPALATLSRLDCIRAVGGYNEGLFFEDWDMWLRLADRYSFSYLPGEWAQYRVVEGSMVRSQHSKPLMLESERRIRLSWIGRDDQTDAVIERCVPNFAEELYMRGHKLRLDYAKKYLQRDRSARALLIVALMAMRAPYSWFRTIDHFSVGLKRGLRRLS